MRGKKGISEVIVTVLLILLSVIVVVTLAVFLVPFVRDNLNKGGDCFNNFDKINLVSENSCYTNTNTSVRVRLKDIDLSEIYVVLENNTDSINRRLKSGESYTYLVSGSPVSLPDKNGGEKSYIFKGSYDVVSVGIVLGSGACDISDSIELNKC